MLTLLILIIVIAAFFYYLYALNKKRVNHLISIAPDDLVHYKGINLVKNDENPLNQIGVDTKHPVHYIGVDKEHRVLFPESKFGNQQRYYLTATSFSPTLSTSDRPSENVKQAVNIKSTAYNDQSEHTNAYLILLKTDLTNAFKIEIKAQTHDINVLNQTYALSAAQLKSLREQMQKAQKGD